MAKHSLTLVGHAADPPEPFHRPSLDTSRETEIL